MPKSTRKAVQNVIPNKLSALKRDSESLRMWVEVFFQFEVTTAESSQKEQRRDIELFLSYMTKETGGDQHQDWTPRLSRSFVQALRRQLKEDGTQYWSDRSINRIIASLKPFAKWIHLHKPFFNGNPMSKIKSLKVAHQLDIEKAITTQERRKLLDAADRLLKIGGLSKDRHRYRGTDQKPRRKNYRPYRNRAIVNTLIETGMRRAAVTKIDLVHVDFKQRKITVEEKGGSIHTYKISREGLDAIRDYITHERPIDDDHYQSAALFLPAINPQNTTGRLTPQSINVVWKHVCDAARVKGKTPHAARHAMGRHIQQKTKNPAAVQRQLGHKNASYSLQYARITDRELQDVLDERD